MFKRMIKVIKPLTNLNNNKAKCCKKPTEQNITVVNHKYMMRFCIIPIVVEMEKIARIIKEVGENRWRK